MQYCILLSVLLTMCGVIQLLFFSYLVSQNDEVLAGIPPGRGTMIANGYPTLSETPDDFFITILGYELTQELAGQKFSEEALETVIGKVFYSADLDGDTFLDKKELALWLHKNAKINNAVEIKTEFKEIDEDNNGSVTFEEYCDNGLDRASRMEYLKKFVLKNGELDVDKMEREIPRMDREGIPNLSYIIQRQYRIFNIADANDDGGLVWEEFVVFSRPDEFEETYSLVTQATLEYKKYDQDKDKKFNLKEFEEYYKKNVLIPELLPEEYRLPGALFAKCDADQDKYLTYEEGDKCFKGYLAVDHHDPDWLMEDADRDGDGKLTKEEVIQEFEEIKESDDFYHTFGREEL